MSKHLSICRLCAIKYPENALIQFNSEEFTNFDLTEKIHQYFIVNITENDILPKEICNCCFKKVLETYEFHQQIEKAQELLKNVIHEMMKINAENDDIRSERSFNCIFGNSLFEDAVEDEPLSNRLKSDYIEKEIPNEASLSETEEITLQGELKKRRKRKKTLFKRKKCKDFPGAESELKEIILYGLEGPSYICHVCGKFYTSQSGLSSHLRCHNGEKLFKCDKCPKQYKYITSLQEHKLCHTDLRPHICSVCGITFRTKRTLDRHSLVHTETLNYACTFCSKRFKKKYSLTIHLRLHTGERPYSCTECNHFFANDSNFIKHLKGRHGLQNVSIVKKRIYPMDFA